MGLVDQYKSHTDLPEQIPVFPLDGALLLPRSHLPLNIFEARYLEMVRDVLASHRIIGMVQPDGSRAQGTTLQPGQARAGTSRSLYTIGCAGRITKYAEMPDNKMMIALTGIARFRIASETDTTKPYREVTPDYTGFSDDFVPGNGEEDVDRDRLLNTFKSYLDANELEADWSEVLGMSTESLVNTLSAMCPYPPREKQALLEAADLKSRASVLVTLTEMVIAAAGTGSGAQLQ